MAASPTRPDPSRVGVSGTPQSAWSFGPYLLGVLALSVIITQLFNAAHGSILMAALFHFQVNGPAWPDAQPWENYLFAAVAIAVVILNRKAMLTPTNAVTDVLMPGPGAEITAPRRETMPTLEPIPKPPLLPRRRRHHLTTDPRDPGFGRESA